ncbi:alpha-tocopherol transfer protein-like [Stomoxys calcitrans]|uniref:alpha-tocopherol transfer protein-like n=1 Tax=Stomoxys calcitrans TaxID=35570 RepID=UPI0027E3B0E7|nr:alpha-tocopherol transfer protein-like [Stomoxys calcitrans]
MPNIRPLPEALQKVACEELNEVSERIEQDLKDLRQWIEKQPHLRARTEDQFLISFLRGCKHSMEKAKSKIDNYYTLRTKYPDFYTIQNIDDPKMIELFDLGVGVNLPTPLNETGPRLMYIRTGSYSTDKFTFADVMCLANGTQEITIINDDYSVVNGYVQILDMANYTTAHMMQITPTVIKKMSAYAEDATPTRLKAVHFINAPAALDKLFNISKSLMPPKQQQRLHMHGINWQSTLFEHIPQKYLPNELGGENGSLEEIIQHNRNIFQEYRDFLIEGLKYGVDEKLRIGPVPDYDQIFGVDGSFRKLQVD